MKRKLFLVLNYGSIDNRLPNVKADKENYLRFFRSAEGGAWDDNEIQINENNFDFSAFKQEIRIQQQIQTPYEYIVFIFCGHGYSDMNGERWIEVRPEDTADACVSLSQIRAACYHTRTLFIADSCLAIPIGLENERRYCAIMDSYHREGGYRLRCKELYNELVKMTSEYIFTAGFAVSLGETAGDNERGGYYSQTLLDTAREYINLLKENPKANHVSFSSIHELAAAAVELNTQEKQHPSIEMDRSPYQLPFIVVPNLLETRHMQE